MGLYDFFRSNLAWMATVACLWPLNIPLAALAYKVRQGNTPIDMEDTEYWTRCTFGSLFLALLTVGFVGLDYYLTDAGLPAGAIHLVISFAYVAAGWWLYFVMFALDDPFEGLSLFLLYMYLPITVLYLINKIFENPLFKYVLTWLKVP